MAVALGLLLALGAATHLTLRSLHRDAVRVALNGAERSAQKLAMQTREVLDRVDQTTLLVKALHESRNPMDLQALRLASLDASEVTRAVVVTDTRGRVVERTSDEVPADLGDRPEFEHHLEVRDRRLTLALPSLLPRARGWAIPAMRRLERPDGGFDGVVVAYIDPAALTRGFEAADTPGTSVAVIGEDEVYRALQRVDGTLRVGERTDLRALLDSAGRAALSLQPDRDGFGGEPRFVTTVPVDHYPLYAVITTSADAVMAGYLPLRDRVVAGAAGIAALVLLGSGLLWQQARRLDHNRRRAQRAESMYRAASEGSLDALFMLEAQRTRDGAIADFRFTDANSRGLRLLGTARNTLLGLTLAQRLPLLCGAGFLARCSAVVATRQGFELESRMDDLAGGAIWLHHQVVALDDGIALISRDITAAKAAQFRLDAMARLDPLTQLPNRRSFEEHLEQATARARRSGRPLTLVFLDLDGFKRINDTLGHAAGDQVLVEVAQRLKSCVRTTDHVSRLGGDEFTVILEESGTADDRLAQCERLLGALSQPHALAGGSVVATPSLGVAVYLPGEALPALRARADAAMYEAKRAGKACLRWAPGVACIS